MGICCAFADFACGGCLSYGARSMGLRARQRPPHVVLLAISTLISAVACKKPAPKPDAATAVGSSASKLNDETGTGETDKLPDLASHPFPLVVWAVFLVERDYFDPSRFDRRAQLRWSLDRLGRTFPGFSYEMLPDHRVALTAGTAHKELQFSSENSPLAWVDFLTPTLTFLRESLYLSEAETHKAEYAALNGLFAALDPHTILLTPEEHDELGTRTRGRFGGIGAVIRREGRGIRLERVLPDMPADKAGLQSGDVLVAIAGRSTIDM